MRILAIETATIAASAAILDENKLHGETYTDYKLKHSEKLLPLVEDLLRDLRLSMADMDLFAVSAGPGSFTGLRIGAATAKAFSHACQKPLMGVSTLEALAYGQPYFPGMICPILDAQQNAVYSGQFRWENGTLMRLGEDAAVPLPFLLERFTGEEPVLFCGDGVGKFREAILESLGRRARFAGPLTLYPRASFVAVAALEKWKAGERGWDYHSFLPNYIRASQAEVNYEVKLK